MRVEEMTDLEKAYFRIKSRERKGLIAVDFVKLFIDSDSRQDVILQNNDYIEIPVKAEVVIISGQVIKPGIVSYEKGKELNYYLQKAGGYGWNADNDKVRIIRAETGVWIKPKRNTAINVGDTILVPERKEIDFWAITRDFLQISAQFATLIFLIQTSAK
jgi:protein involved in polysaccharide export with SLBB domain